MLVRIISEKMREGGFPPSKLFFTSPYIDPKFNSNKTLDGLIMPLIILIIQIYLVFMKNQRWNSNK